MDPEDSPELPPLKRGTYDLDAILAAAENAEFAIPPPASKTSFNINPFASSSPSAFRANFNASSEPSINNSPYPTSSTGEEEPSVLYPERVQPMPRKPLTSITTRKRVSTLKSTLSKFSTPKKADPEPTIVEIPAGANVDGDKFEKGRISEYGVDNGSGDDRVSGDAALAGADNDDLSFEDKRLLSGSMEGAASPASSVGGGKRSWPLRTATLNRVASPVANGSLLDAAVTSFPSRVSSPVNVSSNSLGAGNDLAVYSTPSSSRPASRPTSRPTSRPPSRPNSRVSSNGRYHSRQLSSDSLVSFNNMIDKEDLDDNQLNHSGHVSFVVSDPEHLKILEGEIEDPFSPSMSSIDPDTDAYLSNLMQQSSPFGTLKSSSRGHSPAFKTRRRRQVENTGTGAGDESFLDSTDDALSDKELNAKFRTSRAGHRTPSSPLARAVTRGPPRHHSDDMVVGTMSSRVDQLSLDQILRDSQGLHESIDLQAEPDSNQDQALTTLISQPTGKFDESPPSSPWHNSPVAQEQFDTLSHISGGTSGEDIGYTVPIVDVDQGLKQDKGNMEHVEVDIVVQNVNVHDDPASIRDGHSRFDTINAQYSDLEDDSTDDIRFDQSATDVLANEDMQFHESLDIHESHAQSFAEWMSSSAEISRLDISSPLGPGLNQAPPFAGILIPSPAITEGTTAPHGQSLLSSTPGDANILTSSYTPALSSPETSSAVITSPNAAKRTTLLEKRSTLLDDLLAKARERTKHKTEANQLLSVSLEKEKAMAGSSCSVAESFSRDSPESASSVGPAVTFATVDDVKVMDNTAEEPNQTEGDGTGGGDDSASAIQVAGNLEKKGSGLVRRPSGVMLSSRIRDSTNLDAPRYSIREMEDMKKNVRMDLRIEITNEIREEYERSAEQEAAMFQFEIEELKASLEKEKREKQQLKGVLDEFESSLADIAVSTATEIQTIKEQNQKLSESKEETEEAFVLLKTRYDELKDLNSKHVQNEGILRKAIETLKQDFETSESRYENLKGHADAKLLLASQEMEQARIVYDNEIAMLKAQLARQEMQMRTLEQALEIKNKENEDLILFSEELITKLS